LILARRTVGPPSPLTSICCCAVGILGVLRTHFLTGAQQKCRTVRPQLLPEGMTRLILLSAMLPLMACAEGSPAVPAAAERDSAGVRIVESGSVDGASIRVRSRPILRTGWADDEPTFEQVWDAALTEDGALVADDQGRRVYVVGQEGYSEIGRSGDGPGEFQSIQTVSLMPDGTFAVWDYMAMRLTTFSNAGEVVGTELIPDGVTVTPYGSFRDSTLGWIPTSFVPSRIESPGWIDGPLVVSSPDGAVWDTVARVPFVHSKFDGGERVRDPFGPFGIGDVFDGGFVWATSDHPEIRWYSPAGELTQISRWEQRPVQLTDELWDEYRTTYADFLGSGPEAPPSNRLERRFREQRGIASEELPFFRAVVAADTGEAWLAEYHFPGVLPERYLVVDPSGAALGWVEFPDPIQLLDVDDSRILGIEKDRWDVQAIVIYPVPQQLRSN